MPNQIEDPIVETPRAVHDVASMMDALAVMQALYSAIGEALATGKNGGRGLRAAVDSYVIDQYKTNGAKTYDLNVSGCKVGTVSVTTPKTPLVDDCDAYRQWLVDNGYSRRIRVVDTDSMDDAQLEEMADLVAEHIDPDLVHERWWSEEVPAQYVARVGRMAVYRPTGEVITGLEYSDEPSGTTVRVDARKVAEALSLDGRSYLAGLIEDTMGSAVIPMEALDG